MAVGAKLAGFVLVLVAAFGLGAAIGAAVPEVYVGGGDAPGVTPDATPGPGAPSEHGHGGAP